MMDSSNQEIRSLTCFPDGLADSPFKRGVNNLLSPQIFSLPGNKRFIARVNQTETPLRDHMFRTLRSGKIVLTEWGATDFPKMVDDLALNRRALLELRDSYGIRIPPFLSAIGESSNFVYPLIMTQKIIGQNLSEVIYPVEEIPRVRGALNKLYSSLANYLEAKYFDGSALVWDISWGGLAFTGNTQFMWGRPDEEIKREKTVYLVDLGPNTKQPPSLKDAQHRIGRILAPGLSDMILESEEKVSSPLTQARLAVVKLIESLDPSLLYEEPPETNFNRLIDYLVKFKSSTPPII